MYLMITSGTSDKIFSHTTNKEVDTKVVRKKNVEILQILYSSFAGNINIQRNKDDGNLKILEFRSWQ